MAVNSYQEQDYEFGYVLWSFYWYMLDSSSWVYYGDGRFCSNLNAPRWFAVTARQSHC